jgi:hypothetical protein
LVEAGRAALWRLFVKSRPVTLFFRKSLPKKEIRLHFVADGRIAGLDVKKM